MPAHGESRGGDGQATLLLTRRDIIALMDQAAWLEAAEAAFTAGAEGRAQAPLPMTIEGSGGAFHAKGASLRGEGHHVALKLNGNFPENPGRHGLPTIQGALLLCDGETGSLRAIMDSIEITIRRTAAASALAAHHLARPDSETLFVCGCGEQGRAHVAALSAVLPLKRVLAWDREFARGEALAREAGGALPIEPVRDLERIAESDVVITCTTAREPFLTPGLVRQGTFIAAVGADNPDKSEIAPALMAAALVVADVRDQCATMGDLHHAIEAGAMKAGDVHAELQDLLSGGRPGRTADDEIFIFDSTGTALQDVAAAVVIHERALARDVRTVELGRA